MVSIAARRTLVRKLSAPAMPPGRALAQAARWPEVGRFGRLSIAMRDTPGREIGALFKLSLALGKRSLNCGFGKRSSKEPPDAGTLAASVPAFGARPH